MKEQTGTGKKVRQFGSKEAQNSKVNRFLSIGMTVFYLMVLANVFIAFQTGVRAAGYTVMIAILVTILSIINWVVYIRKPSGKLLKNVAMIGL